MLSNCGECLKQLNGGVVKVLQLQGEEKLGACGRRWVHFVTVANQRSVSGLNDPKKYAICLLICVCQVCMCVYVWVYLLQRFVVKLCLKQCNYNRRKSSKWTAHTHANICTHAHTYVLIHMYRQHTIVSIHANFYTPSSNPINPTPVNLSYIKYSFYVANYERTNDNAV